MATTKHPQQPLEKCPDGVIRFKENKIVRWLVDSKRISMNELAMMDFPDEEREHFAQLIGYSVTGFGELCYVSDEAYNEAVSNREKLAATDREQS
jgi:hypothetical protein